MKTRKLKELLNKQRGPSGSECKAGEIPTHREVKVEGVVKVDALHDIRDDFQASQIQDNAYKSKTLFWSRLSAILIFIYAGITLLIYCENRRSAIAAKSAADTAAKQLELTERPWVRVDLQIAGPFVIDKTGINFIIQATTKATGNSPATSLAMESKMYVDYAWPAVRINEKRDALCEDIKKRATTNQKYLKSMFPGVQESPEYQHLGVPRLELEEALKGGSERIIPLIVTCAIYRSTFNDNLYETAYSSTVMVVEQGTGMTIPGIKEVAIPPERLSIYTETHVE